MTLTLIQDGSVMNSANYLDKVNIKPKLKKNVQSVKEKLSEKKSLYDIYKEA